MTRLLVGLLILMAVVMGGCEGEGGIPSGGDSELGVPESIIGWKMVQYVERNDGKASTIGVGRTITYSFIDEHTILGEGLHTLPTTYWSYARTGGFSATVELQYENGYSIDELTFLSETEGTYESYAETINGTTGRHAGSFTITRSP